MALKARFDCLQILYLRVVVRVTKKLLETEVLVKLVSLTSRFEVIKRFLMLHSVAKILRKLQLFKLLEFQFAEYFLKE